jgi:hypothetical protein
LIFIFRQKLDRSIIILLFVTILFLALIFILPFFRELFRFEVLHPHDLLGGILASLGSALFLALIYLLGNKK